MINMTLSGLPPGTTVTRPIPQSTAVRPALSTEASNLTCRPTAPEGKQRITM